MRSTVTYFDQAADKLRQAMEDPVSGAERTRLIYEALALYHRHQTEEMDDGWVLGEQPSPGVAGGDALGRA